MKMNISTISKKSVKYHQESYAMMVRTIQLEWVFSKRVTKNTGYAFAGVEQLLRENFLPYLFFRKSKYLQSIVGILSTFPAKKSGLGLQKPVTLADEKYLSL